MNGEIAASGPPVDGFSTSIVIPTLARRPELLHAIDSVVAQSERALPIVVVNGNRSEPDILAAIRARTDIYLIVRPEPGSQLARLAGRQAVRTPLFGFLDDDDVLLPEAVATMRAALTPDYDAVVCNAFIDADGKRSIMFPNLPATGDDAEAAMLDGQWLHAGAILYRTDNAQPDQFAGLTVHCHITLMALRAARALRLRFVNTPVVVRYMGADAQASLSLRYKATVPVALRQAIRESTRPEIRAGLRRKEAAAYHVLSEAYLMNGTPGAAWAAHLRSLGAGGLRYLPFTRHLLTGRPA